MSCDNLILKPDMDDLPDPPESSISAYILRRIKDCAIGAPYIQNPVTGERTFYSDFDRLSKNVANSLVEQGFKAGETLIYSSHDGANLHVFLLGVWRAEGVVRSSYPEDTKGELLEQIKESSAKWVLCDQWVAYDCLDIVQQIPWKVNVITFGNVDGCISARDMINNSKFNCNNEQEMDIKVVESTDAAKEVHKIALILPTSGTTGSSKGAIYTHKTVIKTLALLETLPLNDDPSKSTLFLGKQTHVSGCLIALARITAGHKLLMLNKISTEIVIQVVQEYKPRSIFMFPKYLTELVEHQKKNSQLYDLSSVHFVSTAGVIVGPSLIATVKQIPNLKAFIVCYGMTECGLLTSNVSWKSVSSDNNNNSCTKPINDFPAYSCGRLTPGTSLMVKEVTDDGNNNDVTPGKILGPNELGELYFKSPIAFSGYLENAKCTAMTLQNGWIRTGDLGYYDKSGFVFVTDRVKETFKYFNNHISPTEVEQVILRNEAVEEVCVIGIPDQNGGDTIPRAFVVLNTKLVETRKTESEAEIATQIKEFANSHLPTYKQLKGGLFIIPALPYGKTGKPCRNALKHYQF